MSESVTVTRKLKYGDEEIIGTEIVTDETIIAQSPLVPALSTDYVVNVPKVDQSELKAFVLKASSAATVKTYLVAQIDKTFALAADQAILWTVADPAAMCPIATDFDSIKVTCTAACVVTLRALVNSIP